MVRYNASCRYEWFPVLIIKQSLKFDRNEKNIKYIDCNDPYSVADGNESVRRQRQA